MSEFHTTRIAVNGVTLNVVIEGEGEPVLLVHGFPDDHTVWRKQIPALVAAGYRVIAPDTRGCGDSAMPPSRSGYHRSHLVADLVALLDHLGIDRTRVVAHDWGAVICWQLAIAHPERIERYLALSVGHPYCYAHGGLRQKLIGWYTLFFYLTREAGAWLLKLGDWALFRSLLKPGTEWQQMKARLERPGRLIAGMNYYIANLGLLFARPAWVDAAVMGVWSDGDRFLVEKQMAESARFVTGDWRYRRIHGASHWLQLDAPEAVNRIMLDYLR